MLPPGGALDNSANSQAAWEKEVGEEEEEEEEEEGEEVRG